jgi:hypoxanthine phosphoribosyltransferase
VAERITGVLISEEALARTVRRLGAEISAAYEGKRLLLLGVLKGSYVFLADLARALSIPCEVEFLRMASYGGNDTGGELRLLWDLVIGLEEYDVLVVEDILDSGRTLSLLLERLRARGPRSLALCALLDKPARRAVPVEARFIGVEIPDAFVVGYGLDYAQRYRNLPHVATLAIGQDSHGRVDTGITPQVNSCQ